jgi:protein involved in polysaccharide export with SLBB domain
LAIIVWSDQSLSSSFVVSPDGSLTLPPPIGTIQVAGQTPKQIEVLLTDMLLETIRDPRVSVSILAFEGFSVHLIGTGIRTPGFYKMPEGTTLQEVIARGGGLMPYANIRQIALRRQVETEDANSPGYEEQIIDYSRFLLENIAESNPVLKVNDEVIIPILTDEQRRGEIVTILGAVSDQGSHLIEEPKRLSDLLLLAGRPEATADFSRVRIFDLTQEELTSQVIDFELFLSEAELSANPYIPPGRLIYIPQILPLEEPFMVNVTGQVARTGPYPATSKTRLLDAIFQAGGFAGEARLDDVKLIRISADGETTQESIDTTQFIKSGLMEGNPFVAEGDTILVPIAESARRIPAFQGAFVTSLSIKVIGEVRSSGTYQVREDATVLELIILAGGFTAEADLQRIAIIRRANDEQQWLEFDFTLVRTEGRFDMMPSLRDGDTIFVPQRRVDPSLWRQVVGFTRDFTTIAILFTLLVRGRR